MADILLTVGVDASLSFKEFQSGITSMVAQINSNPPKIKVEFDSRALDSMRKQIQTLQSSTTGAKGSIWLPPSATAAIQKNTQEKLKNAEATKQAEQAQKQSYASLNKANTLITQVTNNTKKWTKAVNGNSKDAYKVYSSQAANLKSVVSQYENGTISAKDFTKEVNRVGQVVKQNEGIIKRSGEATQTFSSRVANLSEKFTTWFGITRIVMATVNSVKKMVSASIELDTAMTELKKVTNETDATYNKFLENAAGRAKKLGASLSDTVSATADFARLGFNIDAASELADAATVYKNVGDGITDISTASESIIATMQAFGVEASDAMSIVDKFNEVGNNFAISSGGIGDALLRSASAMHAAGNTLDETIALVTAANTIVQNPESVGTTMKTISMYLRAAKTEAEEAGESTDGMASSVSELRGEILKLTGNKVDIQIDENTFKSTYDIIRELSAVWGELTDVSRANILEMIGGKRNANVTAALIENFELAEDVLNKSAHSAGSALQENEKYLDSINGKLGILKATFQELSANVFDSALIKGIVDSFRVFLEVLNLISSTLGSLPTLLATGALAKFTFTAVKYGASFKSLKDITDTLTVAFPRLSGMVTAVSAAMANSATMSGKATAGFAALATSVGVTTTTLATFLGAVAAVAGVALFIDAITLSFEEAKEQAAESASAYQSTSDEVKNLSSELETVKSNIEALESQGTLTISEQSELDKLIAQNEQLERQLSIKERLANSQQNELATNAASVLKATRTYTTGDYQNGKGVTSGTIISETESKQIQLNQRTEEYNSILEEQEKLISDIDNAETLGDKHYAQQKYNKNAQKLKELEVLMDGLNSDISENLSEIDGYYSVLFDENGNVINGHEDLVRQVERLYGFIDDSSVEVASSAVKATESETALTDAVAKHAAVTETLKSSLSGTIEFQSALNDALDASTSATGLTSSQIETLTNNFKNLESFDAAALFEETANGVHINAEELKRLNEELDASNYAEFEDAITNLKKEIYKQRADGFDTTALESELDRVKQLKSQYEGLTSSYNAWLTAKSGGNERDSYESIGAGYEEMKNILNQGWYGDESLNAYLDLLLSAKERTGDALVDFEKLNETISGTSHSIMDYWKYDKDNNLVTDGLFDFLDDVNTKLGDSFARVNEDGLYEFDFDGDKLQQVADAFGMSTEAVELFERAMIDAGMAVDLGDLDLPEQIGKIAEGLKEFQKSGELSSSLDLDFDVDTDKLSDVKKTIDDLKEERVKIDAETDPELAKELDSLIAKCEEQYYFRLNAETDNGLDNAISIIGRLKELTAAPLTQEVRVANEDEVYSLASQLAELPTEVQTAVGIKTENVGSIDGIISQLNTLPSSLTVPVNYKAGLSPESVNDATGTANFELGTYPTEIPDLTGKANISLGSYPRYLPPIRQTVIANKIGFASGTAHADGTFMNMWDNYRAYSYGRDWSLHRDENALVNELGTESIVRDGRWFPIPGGAHIHQLKKGDIIFSAKQTEELIRTGRISSGGGHGRVAMATGTAFNMLNLSAYDSGTGGSRRPGSSSGSSYSKNTYNYSNPTKSSTNNNYNSVDDFLESFDFIEIAIARIHEAIDRIKVVADSAYKTLTKRNEALADEIVYTTKEINIQQQAYERYLKEANSVGLNDVWASKVRNGAIDISAITDEDLADKIKKYQDFYEKAIECKDAVAELREEIAKLYETRFDNISSDFENKLSLLEHMTTTFDNGIADLEERGYLISTKYYKAMQDVEKEKLKTQTEELESLIEAMSQAVNSGDIEEGSEAWYEMQKEINDTKEAIQETNTAIVEFNNSLRETEWSHFDYLQETISSLTDEADFLIELMEDSDLFSDTGKLTDLGKATMGLHGQNYNVYMSQADMYADEIKKINAEIANDPNNTKLLERRKELLELQRDSILSAKDEKQALIDLVEEGINLELESVQRLIEQYTEALDNAKDLHDYQKKIKDQTSEVAKLQKQLLAYKNDDSEENKALKQKIEVNLAKAQEELEESQYDRYISDQKQLLDSLYSEYELILNQRLDDVDSLLKDIISETNINATMIKETLESVSSDVGYSLSENMNSIWSTEGGAYSIISEYGDSFNSKLTSVNNVLNSIALKIGAMVQSSDNTANETTKNTSSSTAPNKSVEPVVTTPAEESKPSNTNQQPAKTIHVGGKINAGGAKIYSYAGDTNGLRQYFASDPIYTVLAIKNGYVQVRHHKASKGIDGWFKQGDVKAYKSGGLVDYTGLAWVDGKKSEPEAFLNASDTKLFISFRDALRNIASGDMSIPNILTGSSVFDMSKYISGNEKYSGIHTANIGDISYEINIPIDHVSDYNDFMNQLRQDGKFEKFIQSMTIDRMVGGSKLSKTKFKW